MPYTIEELRRIITPIAQAHGLRSVSLFGSYSKGTARRDSDVDLKIEKGSVMSLFQLSGLRLDMEDALEECRSILSPTILLTVNFWI